MILRVTWSQRIDSDGRLISGEYEGRIQGEPAFLLRASSWSWSVWIEGVEARAGYIEDHDVDRARRYRGRSITPLALAKDRATRWAADVIDRRDRAEEDLLP